MIFYPDVNWKYTPDVQPTRVQIQSLVHARTAIRLAILKRARQSGWGKMETKGKSRIPKSRIIYGQNAYETGSDTHFGYFFLISEKYMHTIQARTQLLASKRATPLQRNIRRKIAIGMWISMLNVYLRLFKYLWNMDEHCLRDDMGLET